MIGNIRQVVTALVAVVVVGDAAGACRSWKRFRQKPTAGNSRGFFVI